MKEHRGEQRQPPCLDVPSHLPAVYLLASRLYLYQRMGLSEGDGPELCVTRCNTKQVLAYVLQAVTDSPTHSN
jgi:hypothetical protein